jgi:rubredoxin
VNPTFERFPQPYEAAQPPAAMKSRPATKFTMALKNRRCPKCGAKLNNQVKRCKRCTQVVGKPRK